VANPVGLPAAPMMIQLLASATMDGSPATKALGSVVDGRQREGGLQSVITGLRWIHSLPCAA